MLDIIIDHVESPNTDIDKPLHLVNPLLDSDKYLGRCLIGKVERVQQKLMIV